MRAAGCWAYIVRRARGVVIAASLLIPVSGQTNTEAQSQPPPAAAPQVMAPAGRPSFRAESNLVVIPVSVTDPVNRFVLGLRKEDFKLLDNGVEQPIAHFSGEDVPLSIGLAFDISGSMDLKVRTSRDAAATMLKTMSPGDEAFLVEFHDKPELTVRFTTRHRRFATRS